MSRSAKVDEKPVFGQVWSWGKPNFPMMSIGPGETAGGSQRWVFLRLDESPEVEDTWYWSNENGETMTDWTLIDDD